MHMWFWGTRTLICKFKISYSITDLQCIHIPEFVNVVSDVSYTVRILHFEHIRLLWYVFVCGEKLGRSSSIIQQ